MAPRQQLPVGRAFPIGASLEEEISHRTTEPPMAGTGFEGIAYAMLPAAASVSSTAPLPSDHGAIDFVIAEHTADDKVFCDTLRLPLANTIFHTGRPTTMTLSTWKTHGKAEPLTLLSQSNISHHSLRLLGHDPSMGHIISTLSIPLLPLTVPRRVEECMGNIIRRIVASDGEIVTASSELENVVPRFFRSRGQPAQATTAWALVIPAKLKKTISEKTDQLLTTLPTEGKDSKTNREESWERLWRSDPPVWNTLVSKALAKGARLHRVLSGGGGWGKKAGLLSLDPVPAKVSLSAGNLPPMLDDPEDFASTLIPVVRDGDSIQFFISPTSNLTAEAGKSDSLERLESTDKTKTWGWELGTVPSTVDSIPGESWQHASPASKHVTLFRGGFGALTEGGLTLTRHLKANQGDKARSVDMTTVDVPFSRFWAVDVAEDRGGSDDVGEPDVD
ncbi:hypothetical protein EJ02DRAFT_252521 [Clathrospora elynae]|uniref:Uncharacterized protein n=1 Tax=Clathrospora elynae TaxID=706981 RepID=A0A6A5SGE7_9PLEO|nr:hypothetical protein EJ02DRAFT_252521 [Clathrospora elynae]